MSQSEDSPGMQSPMRRILGNFGLLVRGRGIAAVMLFMATALMARALGPVEFGLVVLIQAYAILLRDLLDFKIFDAVVRYGVPAHDAGDTQELKRLIGICYRVDRRTSTTATIIAVSMAPLIGPSMGMDHEQVIMLGIYCFGILTTGNGTAIGILRLFDRFDILGRQMTIGPVIRFSGVVIAWWFDSPLSVFMAIYLLAFAVEELYLNWCGRREYRQRFGHSPASANVSDAKIAEFPGLRHFLWVTYWQSNLDLVPKHLSVVLAGYLLGPSEAGLLRLARQFSSLLSKPAVMIRRVVFLDLTRSWGQDSDAFKLIAYRTALLGGALGLLFVLAGYFFGEVLLHKLIGKEFVAAAPVLTLMLLAATFDLAASPLRSAAYAVGHAGKVLRLYALSAVIYLILFVALTSSMGLIGAGVAACVASLLPPLVMADIIRRSTSSTV